MHLIVGTAGHIDHGKTTLVKALTGVDTDRLPEEKQRGITIDLGFAELEAGDVRISFVDVPGHERFVKNMLAGASGIDLVMLVIAADEGVMPQAREHFEICRLLQVKSGVIVITKSDAADAELLDLVRLDIAELVEDSFLADAPVHVVSSRTGDGVAELKDGLIAAAADLPGREGEHITRLPIDRSFTVKGFGAVVTGTLVSGEISEGDEMELLPVGRKVRVRGVQTHGRQVGTADAGRRVAVNLGGIDYSEIHRGMLLAKPGVLRPTQMLDAEIEVLRNAPRMLRSRQRVRVHLGTAEILARVAVMNAEGELQQGERGFVQLRLESPAAAVPGEHFILRSYSPQTTIAGGTILLNSPERHRPGLAEAVKMLLTAVAESKNDHPRSIEMLLSLADSNGLDRRQIQERTGWLDGVLDAAIAKITDSGKVRNVEGVYVPAVKYDELRAKTLKEIEIHHKRDPLSAGISRENLQNRVFGYLRPELFRGVLKDLESLGSVVSDAAAVRLASYSTTLSEKDEQTLQLVRSQFADARLQVPKIDEIIKGASGTAAADVRKLIQYLLKSGELVRVTDEYYFRAADLDALAKAVRDNAEKTGERAIDVAAFKEIAGISRKYAIPLLEYFDRQKITRREGDKRVLL